MCGARFGGCAVQDLDLNGAPASATSSNVSAAFSTAYETRQRLSLPKTWPEEAGAMEVEGIWRRTDRMLSGNVYKPDYYWYLYCRDVALRL